MDYDLYCPKGKDFIFISYSNVDWVGCMDDKKRTSGGIFYLDDRLVAWHNKKQELVSLSTWEVEYIAMVSCYT